MPGYASFPMRLSKNPKLVLHGSCASPNMGTYFAFIGAIPNFHFKDLRYSGVSHLFEVGSCTDIVRLFFVL
jgi:hypothetical protein